MTLHPNDMSTWPEIHCQQGHTFHEELTVTVNLASRHGYRDCPPVPPRYARQLDMLTFDWMRYSGDGPYCPGRDAVSETIATEGIWEPCETILTLAVLTSDKGHSGFVDLGAQIGWFSLLAGSTGHSVLAVEADPEPLRLLRGSMTMNDWPFSYIRGRIDEENGIDSLGIDSARLVKIDIEGAEKDAVSLLWPQISSGAIDHMLIEISPVFADYYPAMVRRIVDAGYECYLVPEKKHPPYPLDNVAEDMQRWRIDTNPDLEGLIASQHQVDCWFKRKDASW